MLDPIAIATRGYQGTGSIDPVQVVLMGYGPAMQQISVPVGGGGGGSYYKRRSRKPRTDPRRRLVLETRLRIDERDMLDILTLLTASGVLDE